MMLANAEENRDRARERARIGQGSESREVPPRKASNHWRRVHVLPYPKGGTGIRARRKSVWLGLLLAASVAVAAGRPDDSKNEKSADTGDGPVYTLADGVTAPRVTKQVNPQYSPGSKGIRIQGSVLIGTVVTAQGTPKNTHVVRGLDKDVDAAAVNAVNQWLFEPGKKNGKPVAVSVQIEIHFHSM